MERTRCCLLVSWCLLAVLQGVRSQAMPRPPLAKLHRRLARVGIVRSLNSLTIDFKNTMQGTGYRVQLQGSSNEGYVEVSSNGGATWGSICSTLFTAVEATVVCRQLHYKWGEVTETTVAFTPRPIRLDGVSCRGTETNIEECRHSGWNKAFCYPEVGVSVQCSNTSVKLESRIETSAFGTVLVRSVRGWNTVCDSQWSDNDAKVICRELSAKYVDGKAMCCSKLGHKPHVIMFTVGAYDNVQCTGSEVSINDCPKETRASECNPTHLASVICYEQLISSIGIDIFSVKISLITSSLQFGRVEVRHNGIWGTICSSGLSDRSADVVCREKKFAGGSMYRLMNTNMAISPVWLRNVSCSGSENGLEHCLTGREVWGALEFSTCEPAHVLCYSTAETAISMLGPSHGLGRPIITHDGVQGTLCPDQWNLKVVDVLCRQIGFSNGNFDLVTQPAMDKVWIYHSTCDGTESSILHCQNTVWDEGGSVCRHTPSVKCYGDVKLIDGTDSYGVVYVYENNAWQILCGSGFDDRDANVVCTELGFKWGKALKPGTFNAKPVVISFVRTNIGCTGTEKKILDCPFSQRRGCDTQLNANYAAVVCSHTPRIASPSSFTMKLVDSSTRYANITGRVQLSMYNTDWFICTDSWDDLDATVACRELGYQGGVATRYASQSALKRGWLLADVRCRGNETSLNNCPVGDGTCLGMGRSGDAGVLCYNTKEPELLFAGGGENSGRAELVYEGTVGSICTQRDHSPIADVLCRMKGYNGGLAIRHGGKGTGIVFLSNVQCTGLETTVYMCESDGWGITSPECAAHDINVLCYRNAKLLRGELSVNYIYGIVQVRIDENWYGVCNDRFGEQEVRVICKELGFASGIVLPVGILDSFYQALMLTNLRCTGSDVSIHNCAYSLEKSCPRLSLNYAAVACFNKKAEVGQVSLESLSEDKYIGKVMITKYKLKAGVCADNWDTVDAIVFCREMGFTNGSTYGEPHHNVLERKTWIQSITCTGSESSILDCNITWATDSEVCRRGMAYAFCYNTAPVARLRGGNTSMSGLVEIMVDGQWGTLCNRGWSDIESRVICQQMGYVDGIVMTDHLPVQAVGSPVWMSRVHCDGAENMIWECPNGGWNMTSTTCRQHLYDVRVKCFSEVHLYPGPDYGAVVIFKDGDHSLVCDDGFDDTAATVICLHLGYQYGKSVLGSALGKMTYPLQVTDLRCLLGTDNFKDCVYGMVRVGTCPTAMYASVVCTNTKPSQFGTVSLSDVGFGRVQLEYYSHTGYICADSRFTDNDAAVICRKLSYTSGVAYKLHSDRSSRSVPGVMWLENLRCNGSEGQIAKCPAGLTWGQARNCSQGYEAGVMCYGTGRGLKLRLASGTKLQGRLEIGVDGKWRTVCRFQVGNLEADVACRQLGFTSGRVLAENTFGPGSGKIIWGMRCRGTEKSLLQCPLKGLDANSSTQAGCGSHNKDLAIQCYEKLRIAGTTLLNYGRVEIFSSNIWKTMCDSAIGDKEAHVICRELMFADGRKQCCSALGALPASRQEAGFGNTAYSCIGTEATLNDCPKTVVSSCESGKYASILCLEEPAVVVKKLTVAKLSNDYSGAVMVRRYGMVSPVCHKQWSDSDANVTCRQNGFAGGVAAFARTPSLNPFLLGGFNCNGSESNLGYCSYASLTEPTGCIYSGEINSREPHNGKRTAGAYCYQTEPAMRLSNQWLNRGTVEILHNGAWLSICGNMWDSSDSRVVCRQLGYEDGIAYNAVSGTRRGEPVFMNKVQCTGDERSLYQCEAEWNVPSQSTCLQHTKDAGAICYRSVRLVDGTSWYGRVVSYNKGSWNAVCDSNWDETDASVVCRELGYSSALALCCGALGYNFRIAKMNRVACTGSEKKLTQCPSSTASPTCHRRDYASVLCYHSSSNESYSTIRVADGVKQTGDVVIRYMNVEGRICSDGWDDNDARVVCREVGFSSGIAYKHYKESFIPDRRYGPFWTSNVNCTGKESKLSECEHVGWGKVRVCKSYHYAGVLCFDKTGIQFRLSGDENPRQGRVEVMVDGILGTVCRQYWDSKDSRVFCRQLGYSDGVSVVKRYPNPPDTIYTTHLRCSGKEEHLIECPHRGWNVAGSRDRECRGHHKDVSVKCIGPVRLAPSHEATHGPVLFIQKDKWSLVCDEGFTDHAARLACIDLGFVDGRAMCCSAYGPDQDAEFDHSFSVSCRGNETVIEECIRENQNCSSESYASMICFTDSQIVSEDYSFSLSELDVGRGQVSVMHYGIQGRICFHSWSDTEADVLCRSLGHRTGIAYHHAFTGQTRNAANTGPYWISSVNCTGQERNISDCSYHSRLEMGHCSTHHVAGALCLNNADSVEYRMRGGGENYGRVEISIDGVWGTVCNRLWGQAETTVFCRQLNFTGGGPIRTSKFQRATGPVWLSHLHCTGKESTLHQCPHVGFNSSLSDTLIFTEGETQIWLIDACDSHKKDAGAFCYHEVRLSTGTNKSIGGLEVYIDDEWSTVCDTDFTDREALVACRFLGFSDARVILGSAFESASDLAPLSVTNLKCSGAETTPIDCTYNKGGTCASSHYASIYCSNTHLDNEFALRISKDSHSSGSNGIIEARYKGVWGRVCMDGFTDQDAAVACRELGFSGGISYLHLVKNKLPMVLHDVNCTGAESSLINCAYKEWGNLDKCQHDSYDAGVICSNGSGIEYRIQGSDPSRGRVEIGLDGVFGTVCDYNWYQPNARVLCRQLGYRDGHAVPRAKYGKGKGRIVINSFLCKGTESTLLSCLNSGWMGIIMNKYCKDHSSDASVECYDTLLELSSLRLVDGDGSFGRVEVFVTGVNEWGTVCDDMFDDVDAGVVCRQLGFARGTAQGRGAFGPGNGTIWLDDLKCHGNETVLWDCPNKGFGVSDCKHYEDVGVYCFGNISTVIPPSLGTSKQTIKPPTKLPVTTEKPSTIKITDTTKKTSTTEKEITEGTETSVKSTETTKNPLGGEGENVGQSQEDSDSVNPAAIAVPIFLLIAIIAGIVIIILLKRRQNQYKHNRFDDNSVQYSIDDGSLRISNNNGRPALDIGDANGKLGSPTSTIHSTSPLTDKPMFTEHHSAIMNESDNHENESLATDDMDVIFYDKDGIQMGRRDSGKGIVNPVYRDIHRDTTLPSQEEHMYNIALDKTDEAKDWEVGTSSV